jgi:hypothetical protein
MNPEERITGPISGYWMATLACPVGPAFVGGARLFQLRPRSFWDGGAVCEVFCSRSSATAEDAHAAAVELATHELERLR